MTGTMPPLTWLELTTEDLGRWTWSNGLRWPHPLAAAGVGQWEPALEEFLGTTPAPPVRRTRGEERLLDALAEIVRSPDYCAYVIRALGDRDTHPEQYSESYYAALVRGDDATIVVDEPGRVRLARIHPTMIAAAIAAQLPPLQAAPVTRVALPAQTVALLEAGFARRDTPERTLRSALASAGVPPSTAERLFADPAAATAVGTVGASSYVSGTTSSTRCASWTELPDGGMISAQIRGGEIVWEPLTVAAVGRAVADALGGLGS